MKHINGMACIAHPAICCNPNALTGKIIKQSYASMASLEGDIKGQWSKAKQLWITHTFGPKLT